MPQNITDFYRTITQRDVLRPWMGRIVSVGNDIFNEEDFIYFRTFNLPKKEVSNLKVPFLRVDFNVPDLVSYPDSSDYKITVLADKVGILRAKFENWQNGIFNDSSTTGNLAPRGNESVLELQIIDESGNVLDVYKLFGVYLRSIGDVEFKIDGGGNDASTFDITLAYHFYRHTKYSSEASAFA